MIFRIGTYIATTPQYCFLIRFDFDDPGGDLAKGSGMDLISGDVFRGDQPDPAKFVAGILSNRAVVSADGTTATADLLITGPRNNFWSTNGSIVCAKQGSSLRAQLTIGAESPLEGTWRLALTKQSDFLRTIKYRLDQVSQLGNLPQLNALHQRVRQDFAKTRIEMLRSDIHLWDTPISVWDEAQLNTALTANYLASNPSIGREWGCYVLLAQEFRDRSDAKTYGIMFDQQDRRGLALFWNAIASDAGDDFARRYVRTAVHELAHALNLLHTFDPARVNPTTDSTSFMNYPQDYSQGPDEYWRLFNETFDVDETQFLRHGSLEELVMGAVPFGGHDSADRLMSARAPRRSNLRLELRLKPDALDDKLEFGSPVNIEAKLWKTGSESWEVADSLDPVHGRTVYAIRDSQGKTAIFRPLVRRCSTHRQVVLNRERPALYENVNLTYGKGGFYFVKPGTYHIRAAYTYRDMVVYSNVFKLRIRAARKEHTRLISDTFVDKVGQYLMCWGSRQLEASVKPLTKLTARLPNHPLAVEYRRCRAWVRFSAALRYRRRNGRIETYVQEPRPDATAMAKVLGLTRQGHLRKNHKPCLSNIVYSHMASLLAGHLNQCGDTADAQRTLLAIDDHQSRYNRKSRLPTHVSEALGRRWEIA